MVRSLTLIALVVNGCTDCGQMPQANAFFRMKALEKPFTASNPNWNSLLAGGSKATLLVRNVDDRPIAGARLQSSDTAVLTVTSPSTATGEVSVTTGNPGTATLSLLGASDDTLIETLDVFVQEADELRRAWGINASSATVIAGETVSLGVYPYKNGNPLYGSTLVKFALIGALGLAAGAEVDGENRVFFSSDGGQGAIRAALGNLAFEYPISAVAPHLLTISLAPSGSSETSCRPADGCIEVRREVRVSVNAYGARCAWSPPTVEVDDHTRLDRLEEQDRTARVTLPTVGSLVVTCTIGGSSGSIQLP